MQTKWFIMRCCCHRQSDKSTYFKQVGLLHIIAQLGCFVSAQLDAPASDGCIKCSLVLIVMMMTLRPAPLWWRYRLHVSYLKLLFMYFSHLTGINYIVQYSGTYKRCLSKCTVHWSVLKNFTFKNVAYSHQKLQNFTCAKEGCSC